MGEEVVEGEIPEKYLKSEEVSRRARRAHRRERRRTDERLPRRQGAIVEELKKTFRKAVIANEIFPVFTGSALKNKGVQLVLDAVVDYLPSPLDLPPVRHQSEDGRRISAMHRRRAVHALAFKLQTDPFVGAAHLLPRLLGYDRAGSYIYNATPAPRRARRPHRAPPG
jgi:elongation factor G